MRLAGFLTVVGCVLLTAAASMVFVPAGLAVAGLACLYIGRAVV